jgi:hypothetical protein
MKVAVMKRAGIEARRLEIIGGLRRMGYKVVALRAYLKPAVVIKPVPGAAPPYAEYLRFPLVLAPGICNEIGTCPDLCAVICELDRISFEAA